MPYSLLMLQLCFGCRGQRTVEEKPEASRGHIFFFFLIYSNHRFGTVDLTLVP